MARFANSPIRLQTVPVKASIPASAINGSPIYYDEIQRLEISYKYLVSGGYCSPTLPDDDIATLSAHLIKAENKLKRKFNTIHYVDHPREYYQNDLAAEHTPVMVGLNWLKIPFGAYYYVIEQMFNHPKEIQRALISALYLLRKMGFETAEDTYDYDVFIEEAEEWDDDMDATYKKELTEEIAFHKTKPIQKILRFHSKEFHKHAATDTRLGDWLRCLWHYRKYEWFKLVPMVLIEDNADFDPITINESHRIVYSDDKLLRRIFDTVDTYANEGGVYGLADFEVVSQKEVLKKLENIDRKLLARDFAKMWQFDLKKLKYRSNYANGEYDYTQRRVQTKSNINRVQRGRKKRVRQIREIVRGSSTRRFGRTHRRRATA